MRYATPTANPSLHLTLASLRLAPAGERKRVFRGLLMLPRLTGALALAAPVDASSDTLVPPTLGVSKPRPSPGTDGGDKPVSGDRLDPQAVERAASYPGLRRRVFPAP